MPFLMPPEDDANRTLVRNVHPGDWKNPEPAERYNLVVLGAGSAGLISALIASSLGARVALVERHLMGGDCLNVGCVPSKALIHASRQVREARQAAAYGMKPAPDARPDFAAAMAHVRSSRAQISAEDSVERYTNEFGIDVFLGNARFTGEGKVDVDGTELRYAKAVIATGGRPVAPPIQGLEETGYQTNETIFTLTESPGRLAVIGGGPIGCELAQALCRLGVEVTLLEAGPQVLAREDRDAAQIVQRALVDDGIALRFDCRIDDVAKRGEERVVRYRRGDSGAAEELVVDEILVAAGRAPNVEGLGLETIGVEFDPRKGVRVDERLRTTNKKVYAAGDVAMAWKFTHAADAAAKIVVQNALFFGRKKTSDLVMPWCTYTEPEIAHTGLYAEQAREQGIEIDTYVTPLEKINRYVTDGETEGFFKVHTRKGSDKIVGATIVGAHAGELINQVTFAIVNGIGAAAFSNMIFPYPTRSEGLKATAGAYSRTRVTPFVKRLFDFVMRMRR